MMVPQFWAEGRVQGKRGGRQVTVRRSGWSDSSQAEAQAKADARAAEALQRVLSGEPLGRWERKVPYNGAEGLPIREEIVARNGDTIVTRNSYGARCLNTPNVLFADVDFPDQSFPIGCLILLAVAAVAVVIGWWESATWLGVVVGLGLGTLAIRPIKWLDRRRHEKRMAEAMPDARERVVRFVAGQPEWNVRLYRSPAGLRLLVTHRPFDPNEPAVQEFFNVVGADPIYVQMCRNQQCFRARVTAKPWRIGVDRHMKPRPGVWPVRPERMAERQAWIEVYEERAAAFAACEFTESIGSGIVHSAISTVVKLHDELSRTTAGLPIA